MNKYTVATFIKELKRYLNNTKMNDPDFVNLVFSCIVKNKRVTNKNNELFEFSNSRTSELLHNDISVPVAILNELEKSDLLDSIRTDFYNFLQTNFDELLLPQITSKLLEIMNNDSTIRKVIINKIKVQEDNPKECILLMFIESLKIENKIDNESKNIIWERGISSIEVTVGDIFKFGFTKKKNNKNIVVIPVDTSFSIEISDNLEFDKKPLVSVETLHGMWLRRCQNSDISLESIEERIRDFLSSNGTDYIIENDRKNYPIGTIVSLEIGNSVFFLLACSKFDEYNQARSTKEQIKATLVSLIKYYDLRGQGYRLYIPLIGTGRSRANLSYQESYDIIIKTLIENEDNIQGKIVIVILPEAYEKIGGSNGKKN